MIQYLYLGRVDYGEALNLQTEISALVAAGRLSKVLLLLEHPPVLTLGRNANRANVLASDELLSARGVALYHINRGGDVTYHGPGQLVGYPIFDLRTLKTLGGGRMGPVDFVRGMEEALIRLCGGFGVRAGRVAGMTGVWCGETADSGQWTVNSDPAQPSQRLKGASVGPERKIGAIGIHVAKGITSHGFAFNVATNLRDFDLIVPCGIKDHAVTSLEHEVERPRELPSLEEAAHAAARQFGMVFDERVLAVESLSALRESTAAAVPTFPAEDTPVRVPAEVERLRGGESRSIDV